MPLRWLFIVALLSAVFAVTVSPALAQTVPEVAALHRVVARVELELIQKNLRYLARTLGADELPKREQRRLDLVATTRKTEGELVRLVARPGQLPMAATALHFTTALLDLELTDYKHVNELSVYINNSLIAKRAYFTAGVGAMQHAKLLLDSLDAARNVLAEEASVRQDINKPLDIWLRAYHRFVMLYRDQTTVAGSYLAVIEPIEAIFVALNARDAKAFELARRQLLAAAQKAQGDLKNGSDLDGLDVTLRAAARDFALAQQAAANGVLVNIGRHLGRLAELNADERKDFNDLAHEFETQARSAEKAFQQANSEFFNRNAPNFEGY